MAVAFDAISSSAVGTTDRTWTHTPSGTPRGIVVYVIQDLGTTDEVTGVTYGGVSMTEMSDSPLLSSAQAEDGAVYGYFLGSSIPTGAQTVTVSVNGTGSSKTACAISVTASTDTTVQDTSFVDTTGSNPSITISGGAATCFYSAAILSGANATANITLDAGFTEIDADDFGSAVGASAYKNSTATGDQSITWTAASLPNAILGSAVTESAAASGGRLTLLGVG